jgi:2-(1,2-epoxy-1,2-dihydrophenyl)acetyl-CoA isomerase
MADIEVTRDQTGVAVITLNRPERLNAFSDEMLRGMLSVLDELAVDTGTGAIVLTGAGRAFCAGGDLKAMATRPERGFEQRVQDLRWKQTIPLAMRSHPKPIIAMVNGAAMGAGFGLALASDFRIASSNARFGTAFAKVGFSGDFGTSYALTKLLGSAKARELMLLGDALDAASLNDLGLLYRLVAPEQLTSETMALARKLSAGPRVAHAYMKRNIMAAETMPLAEILELEAVHQVRTAETEDHGEAKRAFMEKRPPAFRGL